MSSLLAPVTILHFLYSILPFPISYLLAPGYLVLPSFLPILNNLCSRLHQSSVIVPSTSGSSQTRGLIIGIVLASVVALALLGALGITCAIRYRRRTAYLSSRFNNNSGSRGNFSSGGYNQGGGSYRNSEYKPNEKSGGRSLNPFASKPPKGFNSRALNAYKAGVIGALKPRGNASSERDQQPSSSFSKAYDTWGSSSRGNGSKDHSDQIPPLPPSLPPSMFDPKQPNGQQQERLGWKTFLPGFGRRGDGTVTTLRSMPSDISRDDLPSAATTRIGEVATPTAIYSDKPGMDNSLKKGKGFLGGILPVYHARTRSTEEDIKVGAYDEKELPVAPEIIITSPTTIPTSPSVYSSNGTTKSGSHRKSSSLYTNKNSSNALRPSDTNSRYSKSNTRSVRMSDPYVNYAAAYAAYAGFEDDLDIPGATSIEGYGPVDGLGYGSMSDGSYGSVGTSRFGSMGNSRSALRESVVLPHGTLLIPAPPTGVAPAPPYTSSNITTTVQAANRNGRAGAPPPSAFNAKTLPASTKNDGNRDGAKKKRTLSDKIKRGTLPIIPDLEIDEKAKEKRNSRSSSRRDSIELRKSSLERNSMDEERRQSRNVLRKPSREAMIRQPSNDTFGRQSNEFSRRPTPEVGKEEAERKAQNRPSLMPNFSSGSSGNLTNASGSPPKEPSPTQEAAPVTVNQNAEVIIQIDEASTDRTISRKSSKQSLQENPPLPPSSNPTRPSTAESYLSTKARRGSSKSRNGSSVAHELNPNSNPVPFFEAFGSMVTVHGSIADRSTSPAPTMEPFNSTGDLSTMAHSTFDLSAFPLPQITMQEPPEPEQQQEASTSSSRVNSRRQTNISLTPSRGSTTMTPSVSEFPMPPLVGSHARASSMSILSVDDLS
jgi:hypothetical protein